jgi:L-fucose isomerase-like protein
MFLNKPVKIGVCPIGKFAFSHEDAILQKNKLFKKMDELKILRCDLDGVVEDGLIKNMEDVDTVVKYFRANDIDALFVPHCNFGTEGVVGLVAKKLGLPTLLWAPRDDAPLADGSRLRDSLCGCFASSKVLHTLEVNYDYIENSRVDDPVFIKGILDFVAAVRVAKALKTARIGQIGMRIDFFWSTIVDEADLLRKFGLEIFPFDMVEFIERFKARKAKNEALYRAELSDIKKWLITDNIPDEGLLLSLAQKDELWDMAEKQKIDAFAIQSFTSLQDATGAGGGLGMAMAEERIPIAAETDVHGAISSVIVEAAAGDGKPSFFPEFTVRHPENDNAILLWHASAPLSLKHPEIGKVRILPPWILKGLPASSLQFYLKEGEMTVCRFDGRGGEYTLGAGEGKAFKGPDTREVYTWYEVNDWPAWEKKLIRGPYVHHCSGIYGNYADILEKSCAFLPALKCERFDK